MHHSKHTHTPPEHEPRPRTWLLPVLLVAQLMVILDITAVNIAMPSLARELHISGADDQLDDHELLAHLRQPAPARRPRRRPARPPPPVPHRPRHLHRLLAGLGRWPAAPRRCSRPAPGRDSAPRCSRPPRFRSSPAPSTGRHAPRRSPPGAPSAAPAPRSASSLGGVLTQLADWRLIFFVNLPVAVALAVAARKIVPADTAQAALARPRPPRRRPRHRQPRPRSSTRSPRPSSAGWTSAQTLGIAGAGIAGLAAFAVCERRTRTPLLRIERLRDRAVGGGLLLMPGQRWPDVRAVPALLALPAARARPRPARHRTRLHPARARRRHAGAHLAGQLITPARPPLARRRRAHARRRRPATCSPTIPAHGSYLHDILPGMLMAGFGLGLAGAASASPSSPAPARRRAGMLSGVNATGHEIGGTLGIAIFTSIAAAVSGGIAGPAAAAGIAARLPRRRPRRPRRRRCRARRPPRRADVPPEAAAQPSGDASPLTSLRTQHPGTRRAPETAPSAAGCVGRFRGARAQRRRAVSRFMCDSFSGLRTA